MTVKVNQMTSGGKADFLPRNEQRQLSIGERIERLEKQIEQIKALREKETEKDTVEQQLQQN